MKFSTQVPVVKSHSPLDYNATVLSLGSCFAVNMAEKLDYYKFSNTVNPFGILFHPLAIDEVVYRSIRNQTFTQNDIFFHNGMWQTFDAHSRMANQDALMLLRGLNEQLASTAKLVAQASHIIITYGTAWAYREKSASKIVANCHKLPADHFDKELLSVDILEAAIQNTLSMIRSVNSNVNIVFTISPVRHIKDGFVENQRSKSHLFTALHQVLASDDPRNVSYFPSYEIMMDELRDYRFYSDDMLHPSQLAVDYIWERFVESHTNPETRSTMLKVENIQKSLAHRPVNPDSASHLAFTENLQRELQWLEQRHPSIVFQ